jgi:type I restriction enzyme, R subunit
VVALLRVYANVAQHLEQAGYTSAQIASLEKDVQFYTEARAAIKRHSGEEFDPTPYDSEMRHLLNTYIQADPSIQLGNLSALSLTELIVASGIHNAIAQRLNASGKLSNKAVAEGIINNVRKTIIRENLTDPRFYADISALFEDLILQRHNETLSYEVFLLEAEAVVKRMAAHQHTTTGIPAVLHGKQAATVLYNNLPTIAKNTFVCPTDEAQRAALALELDKTVREKAPADWRNDVARTKQVQNALYSLLQKDRVATEALVDLIAKQGGY